MSPEHDVLIKPCIIIHTHRYSDTTVDFKIPYYLILHDMPANFMHFFHMKITTVPRKKHKVIPSLANNNIMKTHIKVQRLTTSVLQLYFMLGVLQFVFTYQYE